MEYIIETNNLTKTFNGTDAVNQVSLHIPRGSIYGLLGRNGAGKTTIMKMILGLSKPTSGKIKILKKDISREEKEIYSQIGSSIESPGFYPNLSARENMEVFGRLQGKINNLKIKEFLDIVELPYEDNKPFGKFSLGMKQRLAIAHAMLKEGELLILDEPTNGLDPIGIAEMRELLIRLCKEKNKTILISSHQLSELEHLVDHIGIIHKGKLLEECSYEELKQKESGYIQILAENGENVLRYLKETLKIKNSYLENHNIIKIKDLKYSTLELNKLLNREKLYISEIFMNKSNLEDYFKKLTGGIGIG